MRPQMQRNKTQNHYIPIKNKNETMETQYVHSRLPANLIERADRFVLRGVYSSRTELIADALRRRLEELEGGQEREEEPSPVELNKEKGTEPSSRHSLRSPARSNHEVIANER